MAREAFDPQRAGAGGVSSNSSLDPKLDRLSHAVIGAAIEVHRELGPSLPESVYEEALCVELRERGISYQRQAPFAVMYEGHTVGQGRIDILVADALILELKAVEALAAVHVAQAAGYLHATGLRLALLINFNVVMLRDGIKRVVL